MKTDTAPQVHRFPLAIEGKTQVEMPKGAVILDVLIGKAGLNIIALVDPEASMQARTFVIVQTGVSLPHGWDMVHLRSFPTGGPLIHLFEIPCHVAKKLAK